MSDEQSLEIQLQLAKKENEELRQTIQWMQTSKFWKLRGIAIGVKAKLANLTGGLGLTPVLRNGHQGIDQNLAKSKAGALSYSHHQLFHRYYLTTLPTDAEVKKAQDFLHQRNTGAPFFEWWLETSNFEGLTDTLQSIAAQSYVAWHCHLVAPREQWDAIAAIVAEVVDDPVKPKFSCHETITPSHDLVGSDDYIGFIAEGETLTPHALLRWAVELNKSQPDLSYADSDQIKPGGRHCEVNFKPDWSPDYALSRNYIGGIYLARKRQWVIDAFGSPLKRTDPKVWRYALWLQLSEMSRLVHHVTQVLWSEPFQEAMNAHTLEGELQAVHAALQRRGSLAQVKTMGDGSIRHIEWPIPEPPPLVSIIIPTTGRLDLVKNCVDSLRAKTHYSSYELLFLDNSHGKHPDGIDYLRAQGIHVIEHPEPFNWARLNNIGAVAANGEMLLFLNDDMEIVDGNWLGELVAQAARPEVGAVGALLLYPDGRIQHGGIFLVDHGGGARHYLQFLNPEEKIYQNLQNVVREVSCNTGACLMMRRAVFDEVNGFDEDLAIVGNDVDMCLRLSAAGYRNIWTPFARLVHHESTSRKEIPISIDEKKMWKRWKAVFMAGDPFYNPNLTQVRADCSLNTLPEKSFAPAADARKRKGRQTGPGVNLIGYIRAEMGIGEATRGLARALDAAGAPFGIINYERGNPSRMGDDSWAHRIVEQPEHEINILYVNADLTPDAVAHLPKSYFARRYTIGYWAWELPEFPDEWLDSFANVDEVWVHSSFVQDAVSRKSPVPVVRMPPAIEKRPVPYLKRAFFQLPEARFLFLIMYDIHSIRERKNPHGAIHAFCEAFSPDRMDVGLVIKVNNATQSELRQLREAVVDYQTVHILDTVLSRYEVDSLIHCCDCFISLHRSEGFGLVIAEAMALGRPVIATGWSGNSDFMRPDNAACVGYELRQLGQDFGPYQAHQQWAEPDIAEAARWMRRLAEDPDAARRLGGQARCDVQAQLSPAEVGRLIRERLTYIEYQMGTSKK